MKQIQLTYGKLAIIDDEDFDGLNQHRWFAFKTRHEGLYYAARREGKKIFLMHRQILKLTEKGLTVDHIDGDGLNGFGYLRRSCLWLAIFKNLRRTIKLICAMKFFHRNKV